MQNIIDRINELDSKLYFALILAVALLVSLIANFAGIGSAMDNSIKSARSAVFEKQASDSIAIVELDAKSIQKIGKWPWPRDVHADLIDNISTAGASQIAFDIDFSARSNAASDQHLAEAISASQATIILATFRQKSGSQDLTALENLPLPILRENAILASVNIHPGPDGRVDMYSYGEVTNATLRPSFGAMLASSQGNLGESFRIDRSINPSSITTYSAIDILEGRFKPDALKDKTILVGASAIELGDFFATSEHGVLPGVYIHALAMETLKNNDAMAIIGDGLSVTLMALILFFGARLTKNRKTLSATAIIPFGASLAFIAASMALYATSIADLAIGEAIILAAAFLVLSIITKAVKNMQAERHVDSKTGLPNAFALLKFQQRLERKKAPPRLALLQIANYNEVHALVSSSAWAQIMQSLAKRLYFLTEQDKVFKTGDDQLAWVVPEDYLSNLETYFETIAAFFLAPFTVGKTNLRLNIHCGYSDADNGNWSQLQANASIAAFKATELGYRWLTYNSDINAVGQEKMTLLNDIDNAMENGDIWVAYQPKLDLHTGSIGSAEALARWEHPELGNIRPDRFITILENEGRITDLTLYILRTILIDIEHWAAGGTRLNCSINISVALLEEDSFVNEALAIIDESPVDNDQITFEITETASVQSLEDAAKVLAAIREAGIRISIDDYGTGQSTLTYLRDFPADEIKIDQAFIRNMVSNEVDKVMVSSSINLAHKMNFKVVAEGVEDTETLNLLKSQGCDLIQGWHIGKPVNAESFKTQFITNTVHKSAHG